MEENNSEWERKVMENVEGMGKRVKREIDVRLCFSIWRSTMLGMENSGEKEKRNKNGRWRKKQESQRE